jgi:hypothetical protein
MALTKEKGKSMKQRKTKRKIFFRNGHLTRTGRAALEKKGIEGSAFEVADIEAEIIRSTVFKLEALETEAQTRVISYLGARYSKVQEDQ